MCDIPYMADRTLQFIGSYPASSTEAAMREMVELAGSHLRYLPDGEVGERRNWIVHIVEGLRAHPDLELVREGRFENYDDVPRFRVRRGRRFTGASLDLGHVAAAKEAKPVFDSLRRSTGRPDLIFQAGLPGDLDLALFSFGPAQAFRRRRPFADALVEEISQIRAVFGDDVVFQLEVPVEQVFVTSAPAPARPALAAFLARGLVRLAARAPEGTRFGVHLCLGDLGHKSLARPKDADPTVVLANAVARAWPAGRPLAYVHLPLASGDVPPSTDPAFYAPLHKLRLSPGTRVVAGFLHEALSDEQARSILEAIERAVGTTVDVAASCGLARRGVDAARRTVQQGVVLCAD